MIEESNTSGTMQRNYIFFGGRRIAWLNSAGSIDYYFADAIGSTRAVTNATGTSCFSADYYPYGQENDYTSTLQTTSCSPTYKFTGYEYDSETGNSYAYARYYNPRLGRFLSPDPLAGDIQNPQSLNRYTYVLNNPESLVDPLGLDPQPVGDGSGCTWDNDTNTLNCPLGNGGTPSIGCWPETLDGVYVGMSCGPGVVEGKGDGTYGGGRTGGATGGSTAGTPQTPTPKKQGPPYVCSGTAQFLDSLDLTTKLGLDAELSKALVVQADLFKNNQTGEKGAELGHGLAFFGVQLQRVVPAGADITSDAGSNVLTVNLGPFQYSSQTGFGPTPLSSLAHFGGAVLVGGEVSFDSQRAGQISAQCGGQP